MLNFIYLLYFLELLKFVAKNTSLNKKEIRQKFFILVQKCILNKKFVLKSVLVKTCVLKIRTYNKMRIHIGYLTRIAFLKHIL